MAIDVNYASTAYVAPAMVAYVHETNGRLDTRQMRAAIRASLDELDAAANAIEDARGDAYLKAAARISGIAMLIVYMRTTPAMGNKDR